MKRIFVVLVVMGLSLQVLPAQNKGEGSDVYRYYKACEIIEQYGFTDEAKTLLWDNVYTNPKHILSYLPLVEAYREAGKYNDALKLINLAISNNHKNSDVSDAKLLWCKACVYSDLGSLEGTIDLMEKAVKKAKRGKESDLEKYQVDLAQMYYDVGNYNGADRVYADLLKVNNDNQLAWVGISRNLLARGKAEEALDILDLCKRLDPNYSEIYRFQILAYAGVGDYKKASEAMLVYFDMTGDYDSVDYDLLMMNKKYSIALLKQRIVANVDNVSWKLVLAELYTNCDMYYEAIQLYNEMIKENGNYSVFLRGRAVSYGYLALTEFALQDIESAMSDADETTLAGLYMLRSGIYADARMYDEAFADLDKFIDQYPTYAGGYFYRGIYNYYAGNYDAAVSAFSDGIDIDERYSANYLQRGRACLMLGQTERAAYDFEATLILEPEPSVNRCFALLYLGKSEEALECAKSIIDAEPNNSGHYYNLACMFSLMNLGDEAVAALGLAFELGYKDFRHIHRDTDLDNIRYRDDFNQLIQVNSEKLKAEVAKVYELMANEQKEKVNGNVAPVYSEVSMKKRGGTYEVPCMVNGLPLMMIFDTGAADVSLSAVEATFMLKNGYLTKADFKGYETYVTADGSVHAGAVVILKEVKLGDAVLKNVKAGIVNNQNAPLLLGQSFLEKFGTITIDNVNQKIIIQQE